MDAFSFELTRELLRLSLLLVKLSLTELLDVLSLELTPCPIRICLCY